MCYVTPVSPGSANYHVTEKEQFSIDCDTKAHGYDEWPPFIATWVYTTDKNTDRTTALSQTRTGATLFDPYGKKTVVCLAFSTLRAFSPWIVSPPNMRTINVKKT